MLFRHFGRRNSRENELIRNIKNDEIDSFQLMVDSIFSVNYKFTSFPSPHELDEYLRFSPCLLAVSAYYGAVNIFRYLLINGADLSIKDSRNLSVAHFAVCGGDFEILHLLDEYRVSFDGTLFTAAERGYEDIFKWILYYQSEDLHQKKNNGMALIDASSKGGNWKLTKFIIDSIKDKLTLSEAYHILNMVRESAFVEDSRSETSDYEYEHEQDTDNENDDQEKDEYEHFYEILDEKNENYVKNSQENEYSENSDTHNINSNPDQESDESDEESESKKSEDDKSSSESNTEDDSQNPIDDYDKDKSDSETEETESRSDEKKNEDSESDTKEEEEEETKSETDSNSDSQSDKEESESVCENSEDETERNK